MAKSNILLVGISGPSCSGKTTLARLLRDIWPSTFILHEDDFYLTDAQIPVKDGIQDWDCLESIDIATLRSSLEFIKGHGTLPPDLESKEDQNSVGKSGVDQTTVEAWKRNEVMEAVRKSGLRIAVFDGFLLYSEQMMEIWKLLDVRVFLRADSPYSQRRTVVRGDVLTNQSYATVKLRRETRSGYVTLEGFWEDPPGYVDRIVWPNYVQDHKFLFRDGNVQGDLNETTAAAMKLEVMPKEYASDMTKCLHWACEVLLTHVEARLAH